MLDLAAPAAAIGYGRGSGSDVLTSGDGDYGIKVTTLPWGVHHARRMRWCRCGHWCRMLRRMRWCSLRPIYEFLFALALALVVVAAGADEQASDRMVDRGLPGAERRWDGSWWSLCRINPRLYWGMSNAQVAALGFGCGGADRDGGYAHGATVVERPRWLRRVR